jgi:hypothetical protein
MSVRRFALSLAFAALGAFLLVLENLPAQATLAQATSIATTTAAAENPAQLPVMYE